MAELIGVLNTLNTTKQLMENILFSIIIPTYNRSSLLIKLLKSLLKMQFSSSEYEILVIDNNSSDQTKERVDKIIRDNTKYSIQYFFEKKPGLHNARHRGLKESKGEILCYLDDDVTVDDKWLEGVSETFASTNAVLVGGKVLPVYEVDPPEWIASLWNTKNGNKILGILSLIDLGNLIREVDPVYIYGCNFSIQKKILIKCDGFHPDSFPDSLIKYRGDGETGLAFKIKEKGYKCYYNPKACVFHFIPQKRLTVNYFCKRMFNQGISDSYTEIRKKKCVNDGVKELMSMAYQKGKIFHKEAILADNSLLAWNLEKNYLDKNSWPELIPATPNHQNSKAYFHGNGRGTI